MIASPRVGNAGVVGKRLTWSVPGAAKRVGGRRVVWLRGPDVAGDLSRELHRSVDLAQPVVGRVALTPQQRLVVSHYVLGASVKETASWEAA